MTKTEAIITLAIRYCIDNHSYWSEKYSKEKTGNDFPLTYTKNDYNLFPRYNCLDAIEKELTTLVGKRYDDINTVKEEIILIGKNANTVFTTGKQNGTERKAIADERKKFCEFIFKVPDSDLENVTPLPYKRKLSKDEAKSIRQGLNINWGFDGGYWIPLDGETSKETLFLMDKYIEPIKEEIIELVKSNSLTRIYEIEETGDDYEIEIDSFSPNLYETICCDKNFEWVLYGSHEGTIAFGGDWLIKGIKNLLKGKESKFNKWKQE